MTDVEHREFDKSRFEAFMSLVDFRLRRHEHRTKYEWQMSLAVWALLVGATFYVHRRPAEWLLIVLLGAIVLMHAWFIVESRKRNRLDTETSFYYVEHAEKLLLPGINLRKRPDYEKAMRYSLRNIVGAFAQDIWWSGIQIMATTGLVFSAYLLIGNLDYNTEDQTLVKQQVSHTPLPLKAPVKAQSPH